MIFKEEVKQSIIKLAEYCTERQQKYSHDFCKGCEMEDVCFSTDDFAMSEMQWNYKNLNGSVKADSERTD